MRNETEECCNNWGKALNLLTGILGIGVDEYEER